MGRDLAKVDYLIQNFSNFFYNKFEIVTVRP